MKKMILTTMGLSTLVFANFVKNGNIVTDMAAGLQWQDNTEALTATKTWTEAIDYCENLTLDGYSDWRLPNINELKSIIDRSKKDPAIVDGFTNVNSYDYWASTSYVGGERYAWTVNFYNGFVSEYFKDRNYHVRCVRAGQ